MGDQAVSIWDEFAIWLSRRHYLKTEAVSVARVSPRGIKFE